VIRAEVYTSQRAQPAEKRNFQGRGPCQRAGAESS
jgi:hypothetical protein